MMDRVVRRSAWTGAFALTIESGDSKVCYCLLVPERATCPGGWLIAPAGSTQKLQ